MNILVIGDVVGKNGCAFLRDKLPSLKKQKQIDFVIANGENSADGNGVTPESVNYLFSSGVDVVTTGNHAFRRKEILNIFDSSEAFIRPANYPQNSTPGNGYCVIDMGYTKICVINLLGVVYLESLKCPFETADKIIEKNKDIKIKIIDFHAEATAEKRALGFYLDGKVSAVLGTHTHIQTADETILEKGTGYITDIGMTGAVNSVLGVKKELSIQRMKNKLPVRFEFAKGKSKMDCILLDINNSTGKTIRVERLQIT